MALLNHSSTVLSASAISASVAVNASLLTVGAAAEICSCYLAQELGVPNGEGLENHAAYIQCWLRELENDPTFIFGASHQASKATDYLLSFVREPVEEAVAA